MNIFVLKVAIVLVVIGQIVLARPSFRVKRVSDAHLADLETRIALNNKLKGIAITMPVAGGKLDPLRIGRRRRSQTNLLNALFNQSEEDKGDPINEEPLNYDEILYNYRLALN